MLLPEGFVFSQNSLQDYVDCARRFQLRYVEHCRWPAPETAEALEFERKMQLGHAFHRLMRQVHSGVPPQALDDVAGADSDLVRWWANYCAAQPQSLPADVCAAEVTLSVAVAGHRLEARYDLLTGTPGERWLIVDWKTGQCRSSRTWLGQRLQTRVYPFVLVGGGATLNAGVPIPAQQVAVLYWFAEFPAQPERFVYGAEQFSADSAFLEGLLREIEGRPEQVFPKTEQRSLCRYCVYRSLCWEDVQAGPVAGLEDTERVEDLLGDVDLETIAPIPF